MYKPKPLSEHSQRVLLALANPGRVSDLAKEFAWEYEHARSVVRTLRMAGYLEPLGNGFYQTKPSGSVRLKVSKPGSQVMRRHIPDPPPGEGWTPERKKWVQQHYASLGHHGCAERLGMRPINVHAFATRNGLKYGNLDGYFGLQELARLLDCEVSALWSKAKRAGVLTFPPGAKGRKRRVGAMVPLEWAEAIGDDYTPVGPQDVNLGSLALRCGVGETTVLRAVFRLGIEIYSRKPRYGPPRNYIARADAERVRERIASQPAQNNGGGQTRALELVALAGEHGLTEKELETAMRVSRAAVRFALAKLVKKGQVIEFLPPHRCYGKVYRAPGYWVLPPLFRLERTYVSMAKIYATIWNAQSVGLSRAELAFWMGVTVAVVANYLSDLVAWGLVWKFEGSGRGGRLIYRKPLCLEAGV